MELLSQRLQTIYDFVDKNSVVFDIGSDHGKLIKALIDNKKISYGYANENKKGPYTRLKNNLLTYNNIKVLFSDGLDVLSSDIDTLILAGMGGHLIVDILLKNKNKLSQIKTIICDSHNDLKYIRSHITDLGFCILNEKIVYENKIYYEIIRFEKINPKIQYLDFELKYGPILLKNKTDVFKQKYLKRLNKIEELLKISQMDLNSKQKLLKEKDELLEVIS